MADCLFALHVQWQIVQWQITSGRIVLRKPGLKGQRGIGARYRAVAKPYITSAPQWAEVSLRLLSIACDRAMFAVSCTQLAVDSSSALFLLLATLPVPPAVAIYEPPLHRIDKNLIPATGALAVRNPRAGYKCHVLQRVTVNPAVRAISTPCSSLRQHAAATRSFDNCKHCSVSPTYVDNCKHCSVSPTYASFGIHTDS
eukprot:6207306-Pleurochrysis_carterae.AAC.1